MEVLMAHLWTQNSEDRWAVLPLEGESLVLSSDPPRLVDLPADLATIRTQVVLIACDKDRWVLLWGSGQEVRVNGIPQALGLKVLDDRDEIRISNAGPWFFSTERRPKIEPFPGADHPIRCGRCKLPIEPGTPAVRCPKCGIWYLQTEEHPAWTYAETCVFCTQPTALDAGYRWTPEEL
jgi:hypothetical protein